MNPRVIPDQVRDRQIDASDPATSVWVAANAGSGKTHVLADRVIRLLLQGSDPSRILCITFTKAAAANMAIQVFDRLREWTTLDGKALDEAIRLMSREKPNTRLRERARRLFALALEAPGGLKVQTIHAFCAYLLNLFPFEANVAARFTVLEEVAETQLLDELTLKVLLEAAATPDGPLGRALAIAIAAAADVTFRDLVRETIRSRDTLTRWIESAGGVDGAIAQLSQAFGVAPDETAARVDAAIFADSRIARAEWQAVGAALMDGSKNDKEQGKRFHALAALDETERLDTYLDIFCTAKREKVRERVATAAVQTAYPDLCQRLTDERDRVWALLLRKRAVEARDRTAALITIANVVVDRYRAEKDRRGVLDYEDLIDKTQAMLDNTASAWVHYKLDRGIDHVLIDEAQDTSPKQWAIVRALVAEFFAGKGASERRRTLFVVGDEKQSIFSFQGVAPRQFWEMRRHFQVVHAQANLQFLPTEFKHSFRSGRNVLQAVDTVFARVEAYAGLTADPVAPVHEPLPDAAPGLVEIWDTEKPDNAREIEGWDAPFDEVSETSPPVKLARRIARHVKAWQARGRRAGDVLVLVRWRGALFESIILALKNEGIAVAGADRLVLTEHIAVMDLMTLADALLLPDDDLALATVLKSPLFGIDEDELFKLAWDRKGSLRGAVRMQRPDLAARLDGFASAARSKTPFAFYAELLGAGGARQAILARLGHEAADALDEFLNLALNYERNETPSLQGFVAWLRMAQSEVKRDMEIARDEVRVMTVHGAKGLEAPIVILADTTTPQQGFHPPRLLALRAENGAPEMLLWAKSKDIDVGPMAQAREASLSAARDEYQRLLYVAMTRAIQRLVVCGVDTRNKRPEGCWYDLVRNALEPECQVEPADDGAGEVLRYRKQPDIAPAAIELEAKATIAPPPDWLRQHVAGEARRAKSITPSGFSEDIVLPEAFEPAASRQKALDRGNAVHRLMQSLPEVPAERRAEAARRFLARRDSFTDAEREDIAKQVLDLLADPHFAPLFAPGSRAELSIVGRLGDHTVSGQVDRLVVTPEAVRIADYKTNHPAPRTTEEAALHFPAYVKQLALYRAVLERLYPDRPVRTALLWTDTLNLMEIPAAVLDAALPTILTPA